MAYSGGLYLNDENGDHAQARAASAFRGKVSAYISHLVEMDRNSGGSLENFSPTELSHWMAADRAVLAAAPDALKVLHSPDVAARESAAKELALKILNAAMRKGSAAGPPERMQMAAETPASYETMTPARTPKKGTAATTPHVARPKSA